MGCVESKSIGLDGSHSKAGAKRIVDVSDQGITMLISDHVAATDLTAIKTLCLQSNYLFALPTEILGACVAVEEVFIHGNRFTSLPEVLLRMPKLRVLNASNNPLGKPGSCELLSELPHLQTLNLSMCTLKAVPRGVCQCASLVNLDLSFNEGLTLADVPFQTLLHLKSLNVGHCGFKGDMPRSIADVVTITSLDISGNSFNLENPQFFGANLPESLEELKICSMGLSDVPSAVCQLRWLSRLDLSKNPIKAVTKLASANGAPQIEALRLSQCSLVNLPADIHHLAALRRLDISHNASFADDTRALAQLTNLEELNVVGCLFATSTDGRDQEWFEVAKLSKLTSVEWSVWNEKQAKASLAPYSTKFPIQLAGMRITRLNGVAVKPNLFTGSVLSTLVNVLNDAYYKVDFLFEPRALWYHMEALKHVAAYEKKRFRLPDGDIDRVAFHVSLWRYVFFLALQSANYDTVLIPPIDVIAIHYSQMTVAPVSYRADCRKVSNRIIDCNYRLLLSAADTSDESKMQLHRDVWNRMVDVKSRATKIDLAWLRYDFIGSDAASPMPSTVSLNGVLDPSTVEYFSAKGSSTYVETVAEFFRVSSGFLKCEDHFDSQGVELWVRYARYLTLFALYRAAVNANQKDFEGKLVDNPLIARTAHATELPSCDGSNVPSPKDHRSPVSSGAPSSFPPPVNAAEYPPVPTLGMLLMLHLHRTTHLKYDRTLDTIGIDPQLGIDWLQTREAISSTARRWEATFTEPYLREKRASDTNQVDVEYNMSLSAKKKTSNDTAALSASASGTGLKSSLAGSRSGTSSKRAAAKRVTIMADDALGA